MDLKTIMDELFEPNKNGSLDVLKEQLQNPSNLVGVFKSVDLVSKIGESETATETVLVLIKLFLTSKITDDDVIKVVESAFDKLWKLLPVFKDTNQVMFEDTIKYFNLLPNSLFLEICSHHYTTIHQIILNCLGELNKSANDETQIVVLDLILKLAETPNTDSRPLILEHFKDKNAILKMIPLLFCDNFEVRNKIVQTVLKMTKPEQSFTEVTTAHIAFLKSGLMEKYVAVMSNLLHSGSKDWSDIWCAVIRLLGLELSKGGPGLVNMLLGVLEEAFKSNVIFSRVLGFQCWQELIVSFALDPVELCTKKRMKLLLIPLRANNCKAERVAIEKFNSWWMLITKVNEQLLYEDVLKPYFSFCYLPLATVSNKKSDDGYFGHRFPPIVPYLVDALLQMIGHRTPDCECIKIIGNRVKGPLLTKFDPMLIMAVRESSLLLIKTPGVLNIRLILECLWSALGKLCPPNNLELIQALHDVLDALSENNFGYLTEIVLSVLDLSMLISNESEMIAFGKKLKLKTICLIEDEQLLLRIFNTFPGDTIKSLVFDTNSLSTINADILPKFWLKLGKYLHTYHPSLIPEFLRIPFKLSGSFLSWYEMYFNLFEETGFSQEVFIDFCKFLETVESHNVLVGHTLNACISHLKRISISNTCIEGLLRTLLHLLKTTTAYCMVFSSLNKMLQMFYINYGAISIILKNLPKFFEVKALPDKNHADFISMLTAIDEIITQVKNDNFILTLILAAFKNYTDADDKKIYKLILNLMKRCRQKLKTNASPDVNKKVTNGRGAKILAMSSKIEECKVEPEVLGHDIDTMQPIAKRASFLNRFQNPESPQTSPNKPPAPIKKEDFVVINTDWKFDPKKIPEKQMEKMKERGKDIPALYQDFSQSDSQDLFSSKNEKENNASIVKENSQSFLNLQQTIGPGKDKRDAVKESKVVPTKEVHNRPAKEPKTRPAKEPKNRPAKEPSSGLTNGVKNEKPPKRARKRRITFTHITGDDDIKIDSDSESNKSSESLIEPKSTNGGQKNSPEIDDTPTQMDSETTKSVTTDAHPTEDSTENRPKKKVIIQCPVGRELERLQVDGNPSLITNPTAESTCKKLRTSERQRNRLNGRRHSCEQEEFIGSSQASVTSKIAPKAVEQVVASTPRQSLDKDKIATAETESIGEGTFTEYKDTDNSVICSNVMSSPQKKETEDLTKEFVNNTLDISPIKVVESEAFEAENDPVLKNVLEEMEAFTSTPDIFTESELLNSPSAKRKLQRAKGRSAQLLELVPPSKPSDEPETYEIPEKLMLKFEKELPSPMARPAASIIKGLKRKYATELEETESPKSKRKRVSFHDPPVSCEKQYVPDNPEEDAPVKKKQTKKSLIFKAEPTGRVFRRKIIRKRTPKEKEIVETIEDVVEQSAMLVEQGLLDTIDGFVKAVSPERKTNAEETPKEATPKEETPKKEEEKEVEIEVEEPVQEKIAPVETTEVESDNSISVIQRHSTPPLPEIPPKLERLTLNIKKQMLAQIFDNCSATDTTQLLSYLLSIVGTTNSEVLTSVNHNLMQFIGLNKSCETFVSHAVNTVGPDLAYNTINKTFEQITNRPLDKSIDEPMTTKMVHVASMITSIVQETLMESLNQSNQTNETSNRESPSESEH